MESKSIWFTQVKAVGQHDKNEHTALVDNHMHTISTVITLNIKRVW